MASANKRKSTASRGRKKTTKKQSAPIRREIGATVCGLLALLTILCCFKVNAAFLDLMTSVFRGLIGAGFYILPFSFIMSFLILILHDGRPVALRVTCTFLTAMLIGSLVQLVGGKFDADWDWSVISALWDGGIDGTAGGVLAGGIASLLEALISRIGAAAVVIVGMLLSLITSLNMTVASIVTAIRNRPRAEYAEPQREHKDPAQVLVDTVANKHIEHVQRTEQRRASRASEFDLPVDCVIMSLGTTPNPLIKNTTPGLEVNRKGGIVVNEDGLTSRENVYAGGDAVTGAATVILAMGAGKLAAKSIDEALSK